MIVVRKVPRPSTTASFTTVSPSMTAGWSVILSVDRSTPPIRQPMSGMMISATRLALILPKAVAMTTPMAMSMTLPREMKVLNSLKNFFIGRFLSYSLVSECSPLQGSLV